MRAQRPPVTANGDATAGTCGGAFDGERVAVKRKETECKKKYPCGGILYIVITGNLNWSAFCFDQSPTEALDVLTFSICTPTGRFLFLVVIIYIKTHVRAIIVMINRNPTHSFM